jgi:hypothetical protein
MAATYRKTKTNTWNKTRGTSYQTLRNNFQYKINSYRTLYNQTQNPQGGKYKSPSPATLNTFANWVNKGAVVHQVTASQINRWAGTNRNCTTANAVKSVLWNKFGKTPIKAVCKAKSGNFLVAAMPTHKGKTFRFPRY